MKYLKLLEDFSGVAFDAGDTGIHYSTSAEVPGMGVSQYPTRDSIGSGDITVSPKKKKKKKKIKEQDMGSLLGIDPKKIDKRIKKNNKHIKIFDDYIIGGLGDNKTDEEFDAVELSRGINIEMEHTNDRNIAKEIAKDHLSEDPDYYKKLQMIESRLLEGVELDLANQKELQIRLNNEISELKSEITEIDRSDDSKEEKASKKRNIKNDIASKMIDLARSIELEADLALKAAKQEADAE